MLELWFKNDFANGRWYSDIHDTFMDGGYYKIDINKKLTLLSLNTLYYNKCQLRVVIVQKWYKKIC